MTKESKTEKAGQQIEILELNKETLQDLTEGEAERAAGGLRANDTENATCVTCLGQVSCNGAQICTGTAA